MRTLAGRPARTLAELATIVIALYLIQWSRAASAADRMILGESWADARILFTAAAGAGIVYALAHRHASIRFVWLVLLTSSTFGRALSLVFIGSTTIPTRELELTGATAWSIVFLAGILAALILTAGEILDRAPE